MRSVGIENNKGITMGSILRAASSLHYANFIDEGRVVGTARGEDGMIEVSVVDGAGHSSVVRLEPDEIVRVDIPGAISEMKR
jgi:hypothetical protein